MKNKKQFHIYPVYFDASRSRTQGRRIKKKSAVQNPTINEIAKIATILDLNFEIELGVKYPRFWWIPSGRLKVKKQEAYNKSSLIKKMATQLRKIRAKN
ncbi:MAG: signal recognition particle subunit SRP19/SEC65 family protein [Promethearchaeota archaeon]